ncbi:hypothetical protein [Armatimonas rosea]|uniref:Uncharacterized protein n=1 Tax=Armatimonas rosea TaxID=685828 RepID=A0A7W9W6E2_ARMRO|nr:hypothetical protein [Armatimonas rosea]MBB6049472.1 hypothetical protein [Armatimonas rosea]
MNQPKKITFALLGIVASVGLYRLIATRPWTMTTGRCWERATPEPSPRPDPFAGGCNWGTLVTICPTPAPEKTKTITLKEPYAHGRKTPLSFDEAVNNYYWTGGIASLHRCTPGPDSEEVNTYIKKEHRGFYEAVVTEVERIKTE